MQLRSPQGLSRSAGGGESGEDLGVLDEVGLGAGQLIAEASDAGLAVGDSGSDGSGGLGGDGLVSDGLVERDVAAAGQEAEVVDEPGPGGLGVEVGLGVEATGFGTELNRSFGPTQRAPPTEPCGRG